METLHGAEVISIQTVSNERRQLELTDGDVSILVWGDRNVICS